MYKLDYTDEAKQNMQRLKYDEPKAFKKLGKLLEELMEHPRTGTGKPEPLSGDRAGEVEPPHHEEAPAGVRNPRHRGRGARPHRLRALRRQVALLCSYPP